MNNPVLCKHLKNMAIVILWQYYSKSNCSALTLRTYCVQHSATDLHKQWAGYQPFPSPTIIFYTKRVLQWYCCQKYYVYILTRGVYWHNILPANIDKWLSLSSCRKHLTNQITCFSWTKNKEKHTKLERFRLAWPQARVNRSLLSYGNNRSF